MLCGYDLDDLFAYDTIKQVKIRDRTLGIIRYLSLIGIFIYVVVYVLILQKGYLNVEQPVGLTTTSLRKPHGIVDPDDHTYCRGSPIENATHYPQQCLVFDENIVLYPDETTDAMFITTRLSIDDQTLLCDPGEPCDQPFTEDENATLLYVTQVEDFTIRISHNVLAAQFFSQTQDRKYTGSNERLNGKLVDNKGNVIKTFPTGDDIFPLGLLLDIAGVELDDISDALNTERGETFRASGIVLIMQIDYSNFHSDNIEYTYTVGRVIGAEYKIIENIFVNDTSRIVRDRHGVKIRFIQTGEIGRAEFQTMLIQLVSALGLLSVATLVVEYLMLYALPYRRFYSKYKFQITEDFDLVRDKKISVSGLDGMHDAHGQQKDDTLHSPLLKSTGPPKSPSIQLQNSPPRSRSNKDVDNI